MIYSKEDYERMRKEGEEYSKQLELERQEKTKGSKYKVGDIQVICVHCQHDKLSLDNALLNTRGMSFMGWDWLNDAAHTLTCTRCGYIHWFAKKVVPM